MNEKILFAIPKKGRLYETTLSYLKNAGIEFKRNERLDVAQVFSIPNVELVFLPAKDIAQYVGQGDVDLGITGKDIVQETETKVVEVLGFDYGRCTLALQAPIGKFTNPEDLLGKRIVSSFPKISQAYFDRLAGGKAHDTEIRTVSGSVEAACKLGLADAVVDLIETGETMQAAGLEKLASLMESTPLLIVNPKSTHKSLIQTITQRLEGVVVANKYVLIEYNILKTNRHKAESITPGQKSPTISPLEDEAWIAIKAMISKKEMHQIMDKLKEAGAEDILIYRIENCRA